MQTTIAARFRRMGRRFVFEATVEGHKQLVLRDLASTALVVLEGTDSATDPFWSPDSRSVGVLPHRRSPQTGPADGRTDTGACRRDSDFGRPDWRHMAGRRDPIRAHGRPYLSRRGDRRHCHGCRDGSIGTRTEAVLVSSISS